MLAISRRLPFCVSHDVAELFVLLLSTPTKESTETQNGLVGSFEF